MRKFMVNLSLFFNLLSFLFVCYCFAVWISPGLGLGHRPYEAVGVLVLVSLSSMWGIGRILRAKDICANDRWCRIKSNSMENWRSGRFS